MLTGAKHRLISIPTDPPASRRKRRNHFFSRWVYHKIRVSSWQDVGHKRSDACCKSNGLQVQIKHCFSSKFRGYLEVSNIYRKNGSVHVCWLFEVIGQERWQAGDNNYRWPPSASGKIYTRICGTRAENPQLALATRILAFFLLSWLPPVGSCYSQKA